MDLRTIFLYLLDVCLAEVKGKKFIDPDVI